MKGDYFTVIYLRIGDRMAKLRIKWTDHNSPDCIVNITNELVRIHVASSQLLFCFGKTSDLSDPLVLVDVIIDTEEL